MPINIFAPQQAIQSGTHKNLRSPCNLPNLFSCQISSSLTFASYPLLQVWVLLTLKPCGPESSSNPMFDANLIFIDAQHQAEIVSELPRRPRTVRIDSALDLCESLLMLVNHRNHRNDSANDDRCNRYQ